MIRLKNIRICHVLVGIVLSCGLISCGSNDAALPADSVNKTLGSTTANSTEIQANLQAHSPLIESLAALYPNGQVPSDQSEQAAVSRLKGTSEKASLSAASLTDILKISENVAAVSDRALGSMSGLISPVASSLRTQQTSPSLQSSENLANVSNFRPLADESDFKPVSRVQNTNLYGAYFYTIYSTERSTALNVNSNWNYEGPAFSASLVTGVDLYPVYRFRNLQNGSYFYTIYESERNSLAVNYQTTFAYEGVAWYARQTAATGWKPLYRFRNLQNGTYLFSAYEAEKNTIIAQYSAAFELEGVAYYVKEPDVVDKYIGTWLTCTPTFEESIYEKNQLAISKISPTVFYTVKTRFGSFADEACSNKVREPDSAVEIFSTAKYVGVGQREYADAYDRSIPNKMVEVEKFEVTTPNGLKYIDTLYTIRNRLHAGWSLFLFPGSEMIILWPFAFFLI